MKTELYLQISFGKHGNCRDFIGAGWSEPGDDQAWIVGDSGLVTLPVSQSDAGDFLLELTVYRPDSSAQGLEVLADGVSLGQCTIKQPTSILGFRLRGPVRTVALAHWNASASDLISPASSGANAAKLGISRIRVFRILPDERPSLPVLPDPHTLSVSEIVSAFESLGDNCEMGLVQRKCKHDPMSLLRFASIQIHNLVQAIDDRFSLLRNPAEIHLSRDKKTDQFILSVPSYGMQQPTFIPYGKMDPDLIYKIQCRKLETFGEIQLSSLQRADRVFCFKRNDRLELEEVLPLLAAMKRVGPNTLLCIVPSDSSHPSGTVEAVEPGLLRGYINEFAEHANVDEVQSQAWVDIFTAAARLTRHNIRGVVASVAAL